MESKYDYEIEPTLEDYQEVAKSNPQLLQVACNFTAKRRMKEMEAKIVEFATIAAANHKGAGAEETKEIARKS